MWRFTLRTDFYDLTLAITVSSVQHIDSAGFGIDEQQTCQTSHPAAQNTRRSRCGNVQIAVRPPHNTAVAIRGILDNSTAEYRNGNKLFSEVCVHYHTTDAEVTDYWDFEFEDPRYTEDNNTGIGTVRTRTGDV